MSFFLGKRLSFTILFQDSHYVAIDKPSGMLIHRTALAPGERKVVLQTLRDQLQRRLYPIHRLDRATSGVLVFALHHQAARELARQFQQNSLEKTYLALARGFFSSSI